MAEFERLIAQIFISLIPVVGLYFSMKDIEIEWCYGFFECNRKSERI